MQVERFAEDVLDAVSNSVGAILILVVGLILGFLVGRYARRFMVAIGLPRAVEGTRFERTAQRIGTSTVGLIATLVTLFIYIATVASALSVAGTIETDLSLFAFAGIIPSVFAAILIVIAGLVLGDKAEVTLQERLENVKFTEVNLIPKLVKYSIYYVAGIIALAQLGLAAGALYVLLGGYLLAVIVFGGLALKDVLAAATAGIYLLLSQPYGIGDEVEVAGHRGIVSEVDVFVTTVENDGEEFVVPNDLVFRSGIIRVR
ncbi:mechanosensitive ion channel domain-containing protein [Halomarina salina]|uniref:Mechanosensitive ion channel domain-containing protein n=1 Tax=Halomarina salina TaxID=1872699 RepID=A0ABD5RRS0_9EURY|nr:mechanosensitive ion channel domain-containing protein [Halomarina salina]